MPWLRKCRFYGGGYTIKNYKPIIIMEFGTYSQYMFETIPYLKGLNPQYSFYIRQLHIFNNSRTILYVI